jgi:hypothetical protein
MGFSGTAGKDSVVEQCKEPPLSPTVTESHLVPLQINTGEVKLASISWWSWTRTGLFSSPHPTLLSVSLSFTLSLAPATQNFFSRWEDWQSAPLPCVIKYLTLKTCSDSLASAQDSQFTASHRPSAHGLLMRTEQASLWTLDFLEEKQQVPLRLALRSHRWAACEGKANRLVFESTNEFDALLF